VTTVSCAAALRATESELTSAGIWAIRDDPFRRLAGKSQRSRWRPGAGRGGPNGIDAHVHVVEVLVAARLLAEKCRVPAPTSEQPRSAWQVAWPVSGSNRPEPGFDQRLPLLLLAQRSTLAAGSRGCR
jgi:hypothetical protein